MGDFFGYTSDNFQAHLQEQFDMYSRLQELVIADEENRRVWTSVKDGPPKHIGDVFIACKDDEEPDGEPFTTIGNYRPYYDKWESDLSDLDQVTVTHWMPLVFPDPPAESDLP